MRRIDVWALPVLVTLGVVIPFAVAWVSGALVIPHNDDFNYRRVALGLYETGQIQLTGWTVMSLIGQLLLVQPFLWLTGGAPWVFGVMTAVVAAIGIVASYLLVRPILSAHRALLAVLIVLVFPGFLLNTWNFMTDVPAYAAAMVCLVVGAPVLSSARPASSRWLIASLVVGAFGFSIREFALAAPAAVLIAALFTHGSRRTYVVATVGFTAACVALYYATSHLPGQGSPTLSPLAPWNIDHILRALATLALGLSPVLLVGAGWWVARAHPIDMLLGAGIAMALFGAGVPATRSSIVPELIVGNLFTRVGAPGSAAMAGVRPDLFAPPVWTTINLLALLSAILMFALVAGIVGTAVRRGRLRNPLLAYQLLDPWSKLLITFAVIYAAGVTAFGLVASMFDRYLWPLVLPIAALLLVRPSWAERPASQRHHSGLRAVANVAGTVLLGGLTIAAFANLLNSAAFDAARWRMGEAAVARGFPRQSVDAGFEWVGQHAKGTADIHARLDQTGMWYAALWPEHTTCAAVSSSLLKVRGLTLEFADTAAYRLLLFAGPETPLYLYRVANRGCT